MDPQFAIGIAFAGVAVGYWAKDSAPDSPAVTCHCECASSGEPAVVPKSNIGILELSVICLLCVAIGALGVVAVFFRPQPKPTRLAIDWPTKGKGRKGVFGVPSSAPSSD